MTTAETFARVCHRQGLQTFTYYEYPSLIKGGHQTGQVVAAQSEAWCQQRHLDVLIALDQNGISLHRDEIDERTIIIAEPDIDKYDIEPYKAWTPHIFPVSLSRIARETAGTSLAANTVALGVSAYLLGLQPQLFHDMLHQQFSRKGDELVQKNIAAFSAGFEAIKTQTQPRFAIPSLPQQRILLTGGEAIAAGALAAGLQFYAAYPMSPSSNTFHFVAAQQGNFPLVVRHAEDEIAAINLAVGASFAGVRAMTGSAGGGFALMVETLSLTGVMELPLVILVAQRPGPATGLPTWTGQGDLQFVLRAGHGEFQRVVMAPGTVEEHYQMTQHAFYLAEKYQIPVLILTDKYLIEAYQTMNRPVDEYHLERLSMTADADRPEDNSYRRYLVTDSGISPRAIPGQPHGLQLTNSYEHDEFGWATEEADVTIAQVDKRARKMAGIAQEVPHPYLIGPETADVTFVGWGSTVNIFLQLLSQSSTTNHPTDLGASQQLSFNYLQIPCLWPFPAEKITQFSTKAKRLIMIEGNHDGQAEQLIRQETGVTFSEHIRRYDGRPFFAEDIKSWILKRG